MKSFLESLVSDATRRSYKRELAKFEEYYGKSSKFLLKAHALFLSKTKLPLFQPSDIENRRCLFCAGGVESCSKLEGFGIQFRNQRY